MENYAISFDEIRGLLIEEHYQEDDIKELEQAFEFAKRLHSGQFRISEEPYIIHPMEVVKILIGLRADKHTLMAGFLHDILEDTETKPEEIKEYTSALLECSAPAKRISPCPLAFGESGVKGRIKAALKYRKPAVWAAGAAGIVIIAAAAVFLTSPVKKEFSPDGRTTMSLASCAYRSMLDRRVQS